MAIDKIITHEPRESNKKKRDRIVRGQLARVSDV
jgi:hypothetical protein